MAVQCHDCQFGGIFCETDAGDIPICIQRELHCTCHVWFDIVGTYFNFGIRISCFRVFIGIFARIIFQGIDVGRLSCKYRERVGGNFRLIETDKSNHGIVRTEFQCAVKSKLFFIYPVGNTVQHFIAFAVFGYLAFAVAVEQFHEENVVVTNKGHLISVGRENRNLLRTAVWQLFYYIVYLAVQISLQTIYIVYCRIGTAVDWSCFGCDKQFATVRRKTVTVELLERTFAGGSGVEQHFHRFTCFERVFDNLSLIRIHLRIVLPVSRDRNNAWNSLRNKFPGYNLF